MRRPAAEGAPRPARSCIRRTRVLASKRCSLPVRPVRRQRRAIRCGPRPITNLLISVRPHPFTTRCAAHILQAKVQDLLPASVFQVRRIGTFLTTQSADKVLYCTRRVPDQPGQRRQEAAIAAGPLQSIPVGLVVRWGMVVPAGEEGVLEEGHERAGAIGERAQLALAGRLSQSRAVCGEQNAECGVRVAGRFCEYLCRIETQGGAVTTGGG